MRLQLFLVLVIVIVGCFAKHRSVCHSAGEVKCQKHASYDPCGPNRFCYTTCGGPRGPPCLLDGCTAGCFCDEGYILNVSDGKCIKPEDCSAGFGH